MKWNEKKYLTLELPRTKMKMLLLSFWKFPFKYFSVWEVRCLLQVHQTIKYYFIFFFNIAVILTGRNKSISGSSSVEIESRAEG